MNKIIRSKVFETNSSSCHSITISGDKDYIPDCLYVEGGVCRIFPGEFGWEEETYTDAATKASYCLTYIKSGVDQSYVLTKDLRTNITIESNPDIDMFVDVIKEVTKADKVEFIPNGSDESYKWGYIDHQSSDVCGEAFASKEKLRDFIFNTKSILITDNDNH